MTDFMQRLGDWGGLVKAVLILVIGAIAIKIVLFIMKKALEKSKLDEALYKFVINAAKVLLWIFVIVATLSALNVNTTIFISVLSAAGAAIAIALRDSLANIAGGIIIIFTKPFSRGDYVSVGGNEGSVKDIDLMATTIITLDNKTVIIPNGTITTSAVVNFSMEGTRRLSYEYMVSYDTDTEKAGKILADVARANPYALKDEEIDSGVTSQAESGLILCVRLWVNASDAYVSNLYMNEAVKNAFDEAGINIPYPQIDINIKK